MKLLEISDFGRSKAFKCPMCNAEPGENCVRKDGASSSTVHNERLRAAGFGSNRPKYTGRTPDIKWKISFKIHCVNTNLESNFETALRAACEKNNVFLKDFSSDDKLEDESGTDEGFNQELAGEIIVEGKTREEATDLVSEITEDVANSVGLDMDEYGVRIDGTYRV